MRLLNLFRWSPLVAVSIFGLLWLAHRDAEAAIFMKCSNLGGSTKAAPNDWIELSSIQWGTKTIGSSTGGGGAGKVAIHEILITKHVDRASPNLFREASTGGGLSGRVRSNSRKR